MALPARRHGTAIGAGFGNPALAIPCKPLGLSFIRRDTGTLDETDTPATRKMLASLGGRNIIVGAGQPGPPSFTGQYHPFVMRSTGISNTYERIDLVPQLGADLIGKVCASGLTHLIAAFDQAGASVATIARSADLGATWAAIAGDGGFGAGGHFWNGDYDAINHVHLLCGTDATPNPVISKSTDDGATFAAVDVTAFAPGTTVDWIRPDGAGNWAASGGEKIYKSVNNGDSWAVAKLLTAGAGIQGIAYGAGVWVFACSKIPELGNRPGVYVSPDLLSFFPYDINGGVAVTYLTGVAYGPLGNRALFMVGMGDADRSYSTSPDGVTWCPRVDADAVPLMTAGAVNHAQAQFQIVTSMGDGGGLVATLG